MKIYRRDPFRQGFIKWLGKVTETSIKSSILLCLPVPATVLACSVWYFGLYKHGIRFHDELEDNVILSWISIFGILYSILALSVLATFMGLRYPDATSGIGVIGATTYIFALLFWVIREVDDPFSGIWFIKHVPDGWLEHNPREWRDQFYLKTVTKTEEGERETTVTTTIESTEVPAAEEKAA